jgi:hypothetical protein
VPGTSARIASANLLMKSSPPPPPPPPALDWVMRMVSRARFASFWFLVMAAFSWKP